MRTLCLLLTFTLVDVGFLAGQEPIYEGKTLSQWMTLAKDEDCGARSDAAYAIGQVGPKAVAAIPVLIDLLKDRFAGVSQVASSALVKIGRPSIPEHSQIF